MSKTNKNGRLAIQNKLISDGLEKTIEEFALSTNEIGDERILLKYHQIDSKKHNKNKALRQCRGLIINKNTFEVISFPFERFFNYGEQYASTEKINFSKAKVMKKEDGSLLTMYYYKDQWRVQTTGRIEADGHLWTINERGENVERRITFADLFWTAFKECGGNIAAFDPNYCYMFELCTPFNQVVAEHKTNKIILLGARNLKDYKELSYEQLEVVSKETSLPLVQVFSFESLAEVVDKKETLPFYEEGYVVVDYQQHDTFRIKLKNSDYVAAHYEATTPFSMKSLFIYIKCGELDEYLATTPLLTKEARSMEKWYHDTIFELDALEEQCKLFKSEKLSRKEYALRCKMNIFDKQYLGYCFSYLDEKLKNFSEKFKRQDVKDLWNQYNSNK